MVDEDVPCEDVLAQITLPAEQKKRISELRWAVLEAVSYTHLDVYKRQVQRNNDPE